MQLQPTLSVFLRAGDDPARLRSQVSSAAAVAGFDVPATHRGDTQHFSVHYETSLGTQGADLADAVLTACEADYSVLSDYFGGPAPTHFNVIIAGGIGGAYHYGCGATDLYCDSGGDGDRVNMLVVAEEVEVFEDQQAGGWNCGGSNGEGLSRTLAFDRHYAHAAEFATAPAWLDSPDRPDFVDQTDSTDTNAVSTGCAVLFLYYLQTELGFSWAQIAQAAGATLAATYSALTGKQDAWTAFRQLVDAHFPPGQPSGLTRDNPFPLS